MFKLNGSRFGALGLLSQTGQRSSSPRQNPEKIHLQFRAQRGSKSSLFWWLSCHLKGGVHDPRFAGPLYIEDWQLILCNLNPNGCTKTLTRLALNKTLSQTVQDFGIPNGPPCGCHAAPRLRRLRCRSGVTDETVAAAGMATMQDAAPPATLLHHGQRQEKESTSTDNHSCYVKVGGKIAHFVSPLISSPFGLNGRSVVHPSV